MPEIEEFPESSGSLSIQGVDWETNKVSISVKLGDEERDIYFSASEELEQRPDFLLPLLMLPAMAMRSRLELPEGASARLLASASGPQDIYHAWDAENYHRIPIIAEPRATHANRASGAACFFSGGVDSFYSALKHRDETTHLILIHGFDLPLTKHGLRHTASRAMSEAAAEMGKELVEVETNLRYFSDPLVSWEDYHGGALASVALLFQHLFGKVIIPSSHDYANMFPWGSHPLLDHLWSTESTELEHDGCEATRIDKVVEIGESKAAMKHLRVCFENRGGAYNCGKCEKCTRTMINLRAVGNLEICKTLPDTLNLETVANLSIVGDSTASFTEENLRAVRQWGQAPELEKVLSEVAERSESHQLSVAERTVERQKLNYRKLRNEKRQLEERFSGLEARCSELLKANKRLTQSNAEFRTMLSGRRYRLADRLAKAAKRISPLSRLLKR